MQQGVPQLVTCLVSGNPFHQEFLHKLQTSCLHCSNFNYGSSSSRWVSWCQQRGQDPLVGPVEDVVNFLAILYAKDNQFQSLNK